MMDFFVRRSGLLVILLFFLSGAAGLMYQIIWMRMLTMYVGGSAFSVSIVITVFMAGLALGSLIAGRLVDRLGGSSRLLLIFGGLELTIGLYGILFPFLISCSKPLYAFIYHRFLDNFFVFNALSSFLSALLLLVPTTLMGATLPLLCRYSIKELAHAGTRTGRLYGANTLGAAAGTLLCGFWLIGRLGIYAALATAVTVNIGIGIFCILCFAPAMRRKPENQALFWPVDINGERTNDERGVQKRPRVFAHAVPLYILLAVSGFCAMSYEVIWTKLLALLVGPTLYSFTIVLFTFITGLALGGILFGRLADRSRNPFGLLVATQFAAAASVLAASQFLGNSQIFFAKFLYQTQNSFILLEAVKAGLLFVLMVVPTMFLGASIPVAVRIFTRDLASVGKSVGKLYAISNVGALSGAFSAGILFVPLFGKSLSLSIIVGLQIVAAVSASFRTGGHSRLPSIAAVACAAVLLVACLYLPRWENVSLSRGKYLRPDLYGEALEHMSLLESLLKGQDRLAHLCADRDIIWIDDGIGGLTAVGETVNSLGEKSLFLSVNGKIVTSTRWDLNMMVVAGHLPMLLHRNAEKVLVIGLGSGITAGEMLHYPLKQLDVVEISPEVVEACGLFASFHNHLLTDDRTRIIVQDARTHVALTDLTYDVIVSDPVNPWMAGSANLFTLEHFKRVKQRLNPGGIFVQWFHAYQSDWEVFSMFGRTFRRAFPNSLLVNTAIVGQDYLFVGFVDDHHPPALNPAVQERNYLYAGKSDNMRMSDPSLIYPLIVTDIPSSLFSEGRLHTDKHPYMESLAPRHAYTGGSDFRDLVFEKRRRSPRLQFLLSKFDNIDHQLAVAEFMASLHVAPFGLVRLEDAGPSQMEQYRHIVKEYCRVNMIEDVGRLAAHDREICLPVQERIIAAHIEQRVAADDDGWSIGAASLALAGIYAADKDYQRAIPYYRQGLRHLPDHQMGLSNLAACYERLQAYDKAVDILLRLIVMRPKSAALMTRLAANHLKLGNQDKALRFIGEALRHNRLYVPAINLEAMIREATGEAEAFPGSANATRKQKTTGK